MPETTPPKTLFDDAYAGGAAPWVIGEPQPAIVELERRDAIGGAVLDAGCGAGEHTILLTGLGYDVLGIDYSARAVALAKDNAAARGVQARFEVADATRLDYGPRFDTVVDSALFHVFDEVDRPRYVNSLASVCRPGAVVHILALSDAGRGFGPQVSEADIRTAFTDGWRVEAVETAIYRGVVGPAHADALGLAVGDRVDEPAWLARVRRD
ncbi:class I SAM-dependent methyltransferase [Mycolicibacterium sp. S2-37]|uniref:class I SAM-dependent methyltransferase n=1 Tax=Mycolicibacterium sp. S2-37 TaxID=2810297 RepID=UPI001A947F70|nr:class I SAM-dependent methyltransferase [Mycolicibacterium sp. S2-37]MBO0677527.1 class I SAM-dependent methyltransferase [Mycolicibacterium sp. S2-37]